MKTTIQYQVTETTKSELTVVFAWDVKVKDLPAITHNGIVFVPLCGTRIDPELAKRRESLDFFSDNAKKAGYTATYVPTDSMAICAMGRMR